MAVLTVPELAELRQSVAAGAPTIAYTKAQINAALQATETWFEANRASLGAAIDAAAPGLFNVAAKKRVVAYYLRQKFVREGV